MSRDMIYEYWEVVAYWEDQRRGPVTAPSGPVHLPANAFATKTKAQAKLAELREKAKAHAGLTYRLKRVRRWSSP